MIAGLRRRFIAVATLSIMLVLGVLMIAVDLANFGSIQTAADETLDSLIASNVFSSGMPLPSSSVQEEDDAVSEDPVDTPNAGRRGFFGAAVLAGNKANSKVDYEAHYFSVSVDKEGNYHVFPGNTADLTTSQAQTLAQLAVSGKKNKGYVATYRYVRVERGEEIQCYFLDCTNSLQSGVAFTLVTMIVFFAGVFVFFILVCFLSRSVFYPVEESYRKQKTFITNAGHELKTPLAIIDSCTEVLEMENGENKWTDGIHTQVDRLSLMTQELITMAKFEEDDRDMERKVFDLSEVFREAVEPFALMAEEQGLRLHTVIPENVFLYGNERSVRQVISILADNALKYAVPETDVVLGIGSQRRKVQLFSQNQAEGITAGNHREFFDRFYRGDASRSSEKKGYGIGLSMAQTVVRAHGGTITAQSDDGKTLLILAQLPDGLSGREASKQVAALRKAKMAASDIPYTDVEDTEPEEVKPEDTKTENLKHEKSKPETLALAGPKPEEPRPENGNPED